MDDFLKLQGFERTEDPLAVNQFEGDLQQSSIRDQLDRIHALSSTNYEYLPLFIQGMFMSLLQEYFSRDSDFFYDEDDAKTKLTIHKEWTRTGTTARSTRPLISVQFMQAMASVFSSRDLQAGTSIDAPTSERKSIQDALTYRISVYAGNPTLAVLLAQKIRALIASSRHHIQNAFQLQYVDLPSLSGVTAVNELRDEFVCNININVVALPTWSFAALPELWTKINCRFQANAEALIHEVILPGSC